jgi:hypothetical protein
MDPGQRGSINHDASESHLLCDAVEETRFTPLFPDSIIPQALAPMSLAVSENF